MKVNKAIEFLEICALDYKGQPVEEIYNEIIELLNLVDEDCDTPDRLERGEKFETMWEEVKEKLEADTYIYKNKNKEFHYRHNDRAIEIMNEVEQKCFPHKEEPLND